MSLNVGVQKIEDTATNEAHPKYKYPKLVRSQKPGSNLLQNEGQRKKWIIFSKILDRFSRK